MHACDGLKADDDVKATHEGTWKSKKARLGNNERRKKKIGTDEVVYVRTIAKDTTSSITNTCITNTVFIAAAADNDDNGDI